MPATYNDILGTEVIELQVLAEIARLVGSAHDLDSTLEQVLKILHDTLRMERATLLLLDDSGKHLVIRASYGLSDEERRRGVYHVGEGITGRVFATAAPFVVEDVHSEPLFLNKTRAREIKKGKFSFLGVPVLLEGRPVGVLTVDRLFGLEISFAEDVRFLTVVATLVAQFLRLHQAIRRGQEELRAENLALKAEIEKRFTVHNMIGQSKAMQAVFLAIDKVAPSRATVLLLGESGTGKELAARAIHQASPRAGGPFVKVNCAALPEHLLESELLGHERGAFTGAHARKPGRFELADSGTLFLDEIGELPLELQAKLLRVLQERQFERLGGTTTVTVDVRLVAATNRCLEEAVAAGAFRADLFYRLNVVPVILPPLRERREDIPLLLDFFLADSNRGNGKNVRFSREALDTLRSYSWPGNVRELQNLVERLVIMADEAVIRRADLPSFLLAPPETPPAPPTEASPAAATAIEPNTTAGRRPLAALEREEILVALRRHGWIQARAARELGLTPRQLGYRMRKFGIRRPPESRW